MLDLGKTSGRNRNGRTDATAQKAILLAAALIVGLVGKTGHGQPRPGGEEETLRILSYNIHQWEPGVKDLTAVIKASGADIIGLNEAWNDRRNMEIARETGYNVFYGGHGLSGKYPRKSFYVNGHYMPQVLLTKHKIVESKAFNALDAKDDKSKPDFDPSVPVYRGGTLAVLETAKGNRIAVFVCHLNPWGQNMSDERVKEIEGIVGKLKPYAGGPVLIIGDLNTRSHKDGIEGWKVTTYLEGQGFEDLYRKIHPDAKASPGKTSRGGRIDYIFYNRHVTPTGAKVVTEGVFGSRGFGHSDHQAVFGEVKIR